mgnify:CR=1 FL=1
MKNIVAENPSTGDILKKIRAEKKFGMVVIDDNFYATNLIEDSVSSIFPGTKEGDTGYHLISFRNLPKDIPIYSFPDTKTPYKTLKNNQCLDKYLYNVKTGILQLVEKALEENVIVGCTWYITKTRRLINPTDGYAYDKHGNKCHLYTNVGYTDFVTFDNIAEASKWLMESA